MPECSNCCKHIGMDSLGVCQCECHKKQSPLAKFLKETTEEIRKARGEARKKYPKMF